MTTPEPLGGGQQPSPQYPQQPPVYQQPAYAAAPTQTLPPGPPAPAAKKPLNVVGLISLIAAGLGFIFACIPGWLVVGWILLPIGFILGIVSLFLAGKGKALGLTGLIISIVGTIVGFVVFFSLAASAVNDAISNETNIGAQPSQAATAPGDEPAVEEPAAADGSRDAPLVIGTPVSTDDWTVVINSVNPDGNSTVAEANSFNEAPPAGSSYAIVNYTVTYTGADSSYAAEVGVDVVTTSGNVINSFDHLVALTDSMGLDELFTGASATGSAAFLVPDTETFLVRVRPGIVADEVFFGE